MSRKSIVYKIDPGDEVIVAVTAREGNDSVAGQTALEEWESRHLGAKYRVMAKEESRAQLAERVQTQRKMIEERDALIKAKRDEIKGLVDRANEKCDEHGPACNEPFLLAEKQRLIGERNKAESRVKALEEDHRVRGNALDLYKRLRDDALAEANIATKAARERKEEVDRLRKELEANTNSEEFVWRGEQIARHKKFIASLQATIRDYQDHPMLTRVAGTFTQSHEEASPYSARDSKIWNKGWEAHAYHIVRERGKLPQTTPREHLARAWDEGYQHKAKHCHAGVGTVVPFNPYRRNE